MGRRTQYGETFGDDILAYAQATSEITFGVLPTRPQDAVMTSAHLLLTGGLYGRMLEIGVRDLSEGDFPQVAATTLVPGQQLTSDNYCYNREHSGNNCGPKQRVPVEADIELPLSWCATRVRGQQRGHPPASAQQRCECDPSFPHHARRHALRVHLRGRRRRGTGHLLLTRPR
ncbi:MAG: hypothetical protein R2851_21055 [Caldilineaceae bacterium]